MSRNSDLQNVVTQVTLYGFHQKTFVEKKYHSQNENCPNIYCKLLVGIMFYERNVDFSPYVLFMSNQIQFYVSHASSISNTY
jgi:hypothetical protein